MVPGHWTAVIVGIALFLAGSTMARGDAGRGDSRGA